jgi:8-oxo-dGTP diphosphatase
MVASQPYLSWKAEGDAVTKRIGVAGFITRAGDGASSLLIGRRGKEPNRGLFVLPGGGVEDGESLEDAFAREVFQETGLRVKQKYNRWARPTVIELEDRLILVGLAHIDGPDVPRDGDDLYDVAWYVEGNLPKDISPVVIPTLMYWGFLP